MDSSLGHTFLSSSVEQTIALAKEFAQRLQPNDVVIIQGGLGVGKTHFTKGLAAYFDIKQEQVKSPTYAVVHEYVGQTTLYHFDLYRLKSPSELQEIGFEEYLYNEGICIIEWPELALPYVSGDWWSVDIERSNNEPESRAIHVRKKQTYVAGQ
jgi:tRNA threonylcarbamoyladenosine biosynthesis protein TsaE